ncbi:MAG: hypothetical protein JXR76_09895 [Deltaproteobacteria bacterium]|nr:hypothetical protein [Deltaproteobacteria bacterium]
MIKYMYLLSMEEETRQTSAMELMHQKGDNPGKTDSKLKNRALNERLRNAFLAIYDFLPPFHGPIPALTAFSKFVSVSR